MFKRNLLASMLVIMTAFTLLGCGKDQTLETYKEDMTAFCNSITAENESINAIDPTTETATEELLTNLDKIEAEFIVLADMEVPEQFSAVESLADEASTYMTEAVALYHQAFESEVYDESYITLANESYQRAIKRVQYIGDILMGKIPDDENVEVYYEDDTNSGESADTQEAPVETQTEVSVEGTSDTAGETGVSE